MLEHIRQMQDEIRKNISSLIGGNTLSQLDLEKSAKEYFEKGGRGAVIGEIRAFGGRNYIKTSTGWKFHGKGASIKVQEHKSEALNHHVEQTKENNKEKVIRDNTVLGITSSITGKKVYNDEVSSERYNDFHEGDHMKAKQLHEKLANEATNADVKKLHLQRASEHSLKIKKLGKERLERVEKESAEKNKIRELENNKEHSEVLEATKNFKWSSDLMPTKKEIENAPILGSGLEGVIKDLGRFVVKEYSKVDGAVKKEVEHIINSKNNNYIDFYDSWEENGKLYVAMQKLSKKQIQDVANSMNTKEYKDFIKEMKKIKITDLIPENMALVNGKYKLFDSWK